VGVAGVAALLVVWAIAFHTWIGLTVDRNVLNGFWGLHRGALLPFVNAFPHLSDPAPFAVWTTLILAMAIARHRPRSAVAAGAVLLGANLATHLLKPELAQWRDSGGAQVDAGSWPSGHATASMALALCAILVVPRAWRPVVSALGAAFTLAVCFTLLVDGWHFSSDVVAGYLMAATWMAFAVSAVWASEGRWPARAGRPTALRLRYAVAPAVGVALAGLALFALVALARPVEVTDYARAHTTFVVGAGFIAALALSLVAVLSAALTGGRRPGER
jgi:membrane-associated phospholipid phosphatase